ncbi:UdgX family uracil-DNA binding protein [Novilysobacter spongiicola]|uniref:Type-4 uracil-DNA glycosylase n=1 Tax=Lysobacter spongiicola DSM 21749 TaxID=1122188 RepID=A0A1T4ML68_9GAMM|nr:UdgX family uracil-DNA binding protein [Lysobacter spongiicola]SJZ67820.1 DNA polymerase [Lysobacter spongiicola DSM 21749]
MPRTTDTAALPLAKPVDEIPAGNLRTLTRKARGCQACPLWKPATQTVFGQGPEDALAMLVGEQPGNQEDITGAPFVGPAGQLLDRALEEVGLDRDTLYLTNTVKHFKFEMRGKARLHKRANAAEQEACRMWLAAELLQVQPKIVVALGAMAAHTLFGNQFRVTRERGQWRTLPGGTRALASWHPSAVLRAPSSRREQLRGELVADLRLLAQALEDDSAKA